MVPKHKAMTRARMMVSFLFLTLIFLIIPPIEVKRSPIPIELSELMTDLWYIKVSCVLAAISICSSMSLSEFDKCSLSFNRDLLNDRSPSSFSKFRTVLVITLLTNIPSVRSSKRLNQYGRNWANKSARISKNCIELVVEACYNLIAAFLQWARTDA